jgi:hypothetical protein
MTLCRSKHDPGGAKAAAPKVRFAIPGRQTVRPFRSYIHKKMPLGNWMAELLCLRSARVVPRSALQHEQSRLAIGLPSSTVFHSTEYFSVAHVLDLQYNGCDSFRLPCFRLAIDQPAGQCRDRRRFKQMA